MADSLRLDKFLWFARISASRSYAQQLAESGRLRISGRTVDRSHCPVRVGDVLTFANHLGRIRVLRVEALPARRGPPAEARAVYTDLEAPNGGVDPEALTSGGSED
jgi:ribosome-associated heat shock protein Hsp15